MEATLSSTTQTYLQVAGNVVAREALHPHELQDSGGNGLLHPQLLYSLYKPPVKLRRPVHLQWVAARGKEGE